MGRSLLEQLIRHGAPVLFLAQVFGIFGLPIPDELLLTAAGALVQKAQLSLVATLLAAVGGCLTGITLSYVLGRRVGLPVLQRRLQLHTETLARAHRWFDEFGGWLLAFGYFIPGVRHVTAIAAGTADVDYAGFARYAYPGGIFWCVFFLSLGYYLGDRWSEIVPFTREHWALISLAAVVVVLAATALSHVVRRRP
jgi:membrane protein DedA with SNARE-associated domain